MRIIHYHYRRKSFHHESLSIYLDRRNFSTVQQTHKHSASPHECRVHSIAIFPIISQRDWIPIILRCHGRHSIYLPLAQEFMAGGKRRNNEMDLDFSNNVYFMPDHNRSLSVFLFRNLPSSFSTDKPDCDTAYRSDYPLKPAHSSSEQHRDMPHIHDVDYRKSCKHYDRSDGNHRFDVIIRERSLRMSMCGIRRSHHRRGNPQDLREMKETP